MFKRYWITAITAGLTLISAFAIAGYILGFDLGEQSGERKANTDSYTRHAQDEINSTCARLDSIAQTKCIVSVIEATNEHKRSENDLIAQQNMGRWAFWMLVSTAAMAIITAFGVYYVWRTLVATQKMATDTRDIGQAQVRAYLSMTGIKVTPNIEKDHVRWHLNVTFKNTGQSPARNIVAEASIWATHTAVKSIIPDIAAGESFERVLLVSQKHDDIQFAPNSDTSVVLPVSVTVNFQDVFQNDDFAEEVSDFFGSFDLINGEEVSLSPTGQIKQV